MPQPGGLPGQPILTGVIPWTNGVSVTWDGPAGYYQLFEKSSLTDPSWRALGPRTNLVRRAWVPGATTAALFRVSGPAPHYVGSQACLECHQTIHDGLMGTLHAQAFTALKQTQQDNNPSCLPCHTVGFGKPSGFSSAAATPQLEGVQCESCHGPAGNHAANPDDPTSRPRVEIASTVCGGCHAEIIGPHSFAGVAPHPPTYEEWKSSPHSSVVEDMNPTNRIDSCGRCHSGTARWTMLEGKPLPAGDANLGIQCINCHEPHSKTANPHQLYNPLASTNDYSITTSGTLAAQYNPYINVCAQCHNHRGASWTSSSRAPHHSPQYNLLIGTVGLLDSGAPPHQPGSHALRIQNQCVGCHMQSTNSVNGAQPATSGHTFQVQAYDTCLACHPLPEQLAHFTQSAISNQVQTIKAALDLWAVTKAPQALSAKYGTRAWEYSTPGDLSPGGPGPSSAEQTQIPVNIQKARFNLYLVLYDGSFGVHNGPFTVTLLDTAETWVDQELSQ
ncbi:MAG TPA: multiheme c-type cytochrome [Verrucomicrobiae bacterium]|nr:multiheme c-type cytochrome [Verrucomicrobiae bacterium]